MVCDHFLSLFVVPHPQSYTVGLVSPSCLLVHTLDIRRDFELIKRLDSDFDQAHRELTSSEQEFLSQYRSKKKLFPGFEEILQV